MKSLVISFLAAALTLAAAAQTQTTLYSFSAGSSGVQPFAGLIFDAQGNLYGTANAGGGAGAGTVYELMPQSNGSWRQKVLYEFGKTQSSDGRAPYAGVIFDAQGNLYGTTTAGGKYGVGCIYELTPAVSGPWTESVLYSFSKKADGNTPYGGVIFDSAGNLYGTTYTAGASGGGTVFELSPPAVMGNPWTYKVLHSFSTSGLEGNELHAGLIFDQLGNLYSTTQRGGAYNSGTVFELSPGGNGMWTEKVLHHFGGNKDGVFPMAGLIFDAMGNLYGTTFDGGIGWGTVFELTPQMDGTWTEAVLYDFSLSRGLPGSALIFDQAGNLYGTTVGPNFSGEAFELSPSGGSWTFTRLAKFNQTNGNRTYASFAMDSSGVLYGTTSGGGASNFGTVYTITH